MLWPLVGFACATSPHQPPGTPPSPSSITREEPGGDADNPHHSALERLLATPWGWRGDKQGTLKIPLPDWENWRPVRYWGVPTFAGYRYGDDHHAVLAAWIRPFDEGQEQSPDGCLTSFEAWGTPTAKAFDVELGPVEVVHLPWRTTEVVIKSVDASIKSVFWNKSYAAAYAGYVSWPGTCTVVGIAVPMRDDADLARAVRDRYLHEAFTQLEIGAKAPEP
jgi:hypothetical protein